MKKSLVLVFIAAVIPLAACSGDIDMKKNEDVVIDKKNKTVTEIKDSEGKGGSYFVATNRTWEFGDVRQICDDTLVGTKSLFGSVSISAVRDCKPHSWADPKKLSEMKSLLGLENE